MGFGGDSLGIEEVLEGVGYAVGEGLEIRPGPFLVRREEPGPWPFRVRRVT